jgi:OmpA-OmpF porin, OOP family
MIFGSASMQTTKEIHVKKKLLLIILIFCFSCTSAYAGFGGFLNNLVDKAKEKVEGDANNGATDNDAGAQGANADSGRGAGNRNAGAKQDNGQEADSGAGGQRPPRLIQYKNYDFVPGDKIIFESQLADEETGEIPSQFILKEGQMDVETEDGENVIHVPQGSGTTFSPRMRTSHYLPEQFTVEFDFKNERFGLNHITVRFGDGDGAIEDLRLDDSSLTWTTGDVTFPSNLKTSSDHPMVWHHIAIAVNKNQGKVYVDQFRVANVNNIKGKGQAIIFVVDGYENSFLKNIRIAAGGINIYKKVATDGKIVTHGILFDVDKSTLKPQSMGTINKICALLKKEPSLKFEIDGHTDNSGSSKHNMELSRQRADAVKDELVKLGIDASRLTTRGFGDTRPMDSNDTPEGKANNRRVEFVKV